MTAVQRITGSTADSEEADVPNTIGNNVHVGADTSALPQTLTFAAGAALPRPRSCTLVQTIHRHWALHTATCWD